MKLHARWALIVAFACSICWAAGRDEHAPDVSELIRKSVAANTADWKLQPQYSYRDHETKGKVDASGRLHIDSSRIFEITMIEGSPYERLVGINDEPLSPARQQQEDAKMKREIQRRQSESASDRRDRVAKYQSDRAEEHLLMQQMTEAFNFKYAGTDQIDGVPCYVLDATPNPDYHPPVEKARVLTGMKGRLWIAKNGFHWVRVRAEVINPVQFGFFIAKVKPGTSFQLDQAPVGGVWLPARFTQSVNATVLGVYELRNTEESRFTDYHRILLTAETGPPAS